tara:strand:+ start:1427 stop:1609 length:183 start_codon:yes stop_codon:yes gene_type:complete
MNELQIIVMILVGLGFGYHMYKTGIRTGAEMTLDQLHARKIIRYDHKGDIKPNQFFQEED